jgi:hypothetical protein
MSECQQDIYNLASGTWEELGSPSAPSIAFISGWYSSNPSIGKLNTAINTCFSGLSGCITPSLGDEESAIYKELYKISYFDLKIAQATNSALTDSWIELRDDVSTIKRQNKNEVAKTILLQRTESYKTLKDMIFSYQQNNSAARFVNMGENNEINPYSASDYYGDSIHRNRL